MQAHAIYIPAAEDADRGTFCILTGYLVARLLTRDSFCTVLARGVRELHEYSVVVVWVHPALDQ